MYRAIGWGSQTIMVLPILAMLVVIAVLFFNILAFKNY